MKAIRLAALVGSSLIGLMSMPALAQDQVPPMDGSGADAAGGASNPGELPADQITESAEPVISSDNTIVVQARRRDESLQDVPLSVQAVTGNQLAKLEIRNFADVAAVVPGLQLTRAPGGVQNTVTMRGINFNSTAAGPQSAVELYRNDVVTNSAAIFQALYDIGQIEVLRGPQGTLRGRASPSGSITITTRRPNLSEVGGFMEGTAAEEGRYSLTGAINVPVVADKLAVRVAGYASGGPVIMLKASISARAQSVTTRPTASSRCELASVPTRSTASWCSMPITRRPSARSGRSSRSNRAESRTPASSRAG